MIIVITRHIMCVQWFWFASQGAVGWRCTLTTQLNDKPLSCAVQAWRSPSALCFTCGLQGKMQTQCGRCRTPATAITTTRLPRHRWGVGGHGGHCLRKPKHARPPLESSSITVVPHKDVQGPRGRSEAMHNSQLHNCTQLHDGTLVPLLVPARAVATRG